MLHNLPREPFPDNRWFYLFLIVHLLAWTLAPIAVRYNLPMDALEGTTWGQTLQWGYDKNPFLNAWLTALAVHWGGPSGWMIYLFSQISVLICFLCVFHLAKRMLPLSYALIAVLLLEGVQYFNLHAIDFNDNTLELSLWALTIVFFYHALQNGRYWAWLGTGFWAALGMMAKYYTAALLFPMALLLVLDRNQWRHFKALPLYLGLLVFLIVVTPHTLWLFQHDFITVTYVFDRTSSAPSWFNHLFFPAQFAWQQFEVFIPALLLIGLLFLGKKTVAAIPRFSMSRFDKRFLFFTGLGPFVLTVLLSLLTGIKLRAGWGMPLLSFWGLIAIAWLKPALTTKRLYHFIGTVFALLGLLVTGYCVTFLRAADTSSALYPGKQIAEVITQEWMDTYHEPLHYVAGPRWISGNISFYSAAHPLVFMEWDEKRSPWINRNDLQAKGAVFVWDAEKNPKLLQELQKQYPKLLPAHTLEFAWQRNDKLPPIKLEVAFLPPENR